MNPLTFGRARTGRSARGGANRALERVISQCHRGVTASKRVFVSGSVGVTTSNKSLVTLISLTISHDVMATDPETDTMVLLRLSYGSARGPNSRESFTECVHEAHRLSHSHTRRRVIVHVPSGEKSAGMTARTGEGNRGCSQGFPLPVIRRQQDGMVFPLSQASVNRGLPR